MARQAQVSLMFVGHAFHAGARGEAGGAASKDSLWGVAQVGKELVSFSGRRGGKLKFKAESKTGLLVLRAVFSDKCNGLGVSVPYTDVTAKIAKVDETLVDRIAQDFKVAKTAGKVTTRKLELALA